MLLVLLSAIGMGGLLGVSYYSLHEVIFNQNIKQMQWMVKTVHTIITSDMKERAARNVPLEISQQQTIRAVQELVRDKRNYFWICDMDGVLLAHPDKSMIGVGMTRDENKKIAEYAQNFIDVVKKQGEGLAFYFWREYPEKKKVAYVIGIPEWNWILGESIFVEDIENEINTMFIKLNIATFFFLLFLLLLASLFGRSISRPLLRINKVMTALASGNLDVSVDLGNRKDEIGSMAKTIDVFIEHARRIAQIEAEKAETDKMKSEFVSIVSHELRTPLTSIQGAIGYILGTAKATLPAQIADLLQIAKDNSERLTLLINDLLDVDRAAAGELHLTIKPEKLMPLILQGIEMNRAYAEKYCVRLFLDSPPFKNIELPLDRARFLQVLSNLLSNAVKFSPAGSAVHLSVEDYDERIRIYVIDKGAGIPKEFRARIFQKFFQAQRPSAQKKGGSGLGLYISKTLVERMGGRIGFESEVGGGTSFWIEFPSVSHAKSQDGGLA
ncbi:MAG: ATP-binding protein [Alphaproteobacteria bacterium]|nr:ATP-binding protein [Alphaproteobacteria bacterium]